MNVIKAINSPLAFNYDAGVPPFANTKSLLFDGTDDRLDCGDFSVLSGASAVSVSTWFNLTSASNRMLIDFKDGTSRVLIQIRNSSQTFLYVNGVYGDFPFVPVNNVWYSLVYVFNGSGATNADKLKLYINNVEIIASSYTATVPSALGTFTPAMVSNIGALSTGTNVFVGNIDEVSIFDRAVNLTEIATLSTAPTLDLTSLNSIAWYRMGDNGSWKSPQWLIPNNENKDKVSNYSMAFDGTDQHLNIGAPSALSNTSNFSISCWVKQTTSAINYRRVFGRLASASDMILLGTTTTTNNFIFYIENGGSYSFVESNVGIGFNVWKHVTLVFDGSLTGNQNRAKIYVDGVNVTATDSGTIPASTSVDVSDFYLGKVNGLGSFYYYGNMDEFSIFDYSLTPAEVLFISSEPTDLTSLSPTSWLKLGDNSTFAGGVWTVVDEVGTNDGSSVNMDIEDRIGEAPNSTNNALSSNMDFVDVVPDVP